MRILLENLPRPAGYPFSSMRELRTLVEGYRDLLGLVLDTGHACVQRKDPVEEIRIAADRLYGTHLHDVDYDEPVDSHWVPTYGGLDWEAILGALRDAQYAGMFTLESQHGRGDETPDEVARLSYQVATEWDLE